MRLLIPLILAFIAVIALDENFRKVLITYIINNWQGLIYASGSGILWLTFSFCMVNLTHANMKHNEGKCLLDLNDKFESIYNESQSIKHEILKRKSKSITKEDKSNIEKNCNRYWDLHFSEFYFWNERLLNGNIYSNWLFFQSYHKDDEFIAGSGISYKSTWNKAIKKNRFYGQCNFVKLINLIMSDAEDKSTIELIANNKIEEVKWSGFVFVTQS